MEQKRLFDAPETPSSASVPGGLTPEERERYRQRLAEALKDPAFRAIDGFPIGSDEDILALSDPPFYTACPNPFLQEWLQEHAKPYDPATDTYQRTPFAADVSEGKNHPIYNAHSYHTKVPHRAIMRYILHYTEPGDVVYDGFCGTGMTGVAAQLCGDRAEVEALGADPAKGKPGDYVVDDAGDIWERAAWEAHQALAAGKPNPHPLITHPQPFSKLGARKAVLNDLSPAATFIAYNYNTPVDAAAFRREAERILETVEQECGWMYVTLHRPDGRADADWEAHAAALGAELERCPDADAARAWVQKHRSELGRINYVVWSDVFLCPACNGEIVFYDAAVDHAGGKVRDTFHCHHCRAAVTKRQCARLFATRIDRALGEPVRQAVQRPVLVNYTLGKKRCEKRADACDRSVIALIDRLPIPYWFPADRLPDGKETRRNDPIGLTHVHHFYTTRNLAVLASMYSLARCTSCGICVFYVNYATLGFSKLSRYVPNHFSQVNRYLSGTLYIASQQVEVSPEYILRGKLKRLSGNELKKWGHIYVSMISCMSANNNIVGASSVDYVFTDPPFGGNLNYSELNFLWEAWLKVRTNAAPEAVTNPVQRKGLAEYQALMTDCFRSYYRALKPGRWMTVEFHNSDEKVWNAIHEALQQAGFVVADVRIIDKQQYSFKQVTTAGAAKKDLVISCYKPTEAFLQRFDSVKSTPEGVLAFVMEHLAKLPSATLTPGGLLEINAERTLSVLYDRMIAWHLLQGARIPCSAQQFEQLLAERLYEEDSMWFLPEQLAEYRARKLRGASVETGRLFVQDEQSAVAWVRAQLQERPQTLGELTPLFMQELKEWPSTEPRPELRELLSAHFIPDDDGRWHIPDPENAEHLQRLLREQLLQQFAEYAAGTGPLKLFRKQALLTGFEYCWNTRQYAVIVKLCQRIKPESLQSDRDLMMFYEVALNKVGDADISQVSFTREHETGTLF